MITDKIKPAPGYARADAPFYADAGLELEGVAPDALWVNLLNISTWPRMDSDIVDIQFEDPGRNDPHLVDKVQFYFDTSDGKRMRCEVICCTSPKDDRVGRLALRVAVFESETKQINDAVVEFIVGVPDRHGVLTIACSVSAKNEPADAATRNLGDELQAALRRLAKYSLKHD